MGGRFGAAESARAVKSRLALGTVQFGLPYGIASGGVQVGRGEAAEILQHARSAGLDTLDTAITYGDSERVLGELGVKQWRVVSKLPPVPDSCADVVTWVRESAAGSLRRLAISSLYGLLLHRPQELSGRRGGELYDGLTSVKADGLVRKVGISVYGPSDLEAVWNLFPMDIVQAPFSVFDRQLATSGWLMRLHSQRVEVHTRSTFLQGLLLTEPKRRPQIFDRWRSLWDLWDDWLLQSGLTPLQACLGFALSQPEIDRVIVGVDSTSQLQEILDCEIDCRVIAPASLASADPQLINPSRWKIP